MCGKVERDRNQIMQIKYFGDFGWKSGFLVTVSRMVPVNDASLWMRVERLEHSLREPHQQIPLLSLSYG